MHRINLCRCLTLGIITLLSAGILSCTDTRQAPVVSKAVEGKARDFVLKDLNGEKFMLSQQEGKPVLIIFSTTWCPTCRAEISHYKKIYDTYAPRGLIVVNIDIQETKDKLSRFHERYQLPYHVLLDEKGLVAEAYQITGVPTMILIDQNRNLVSRQYLAIDGLLESVLKGL